MPDQLPFVACLCPTFRRPARLVQNAIACFQAQTYPADRRLLIVLDDAGDLAPQQGDRWEVVSRPERYPTLPDKYHALVEMTPEADVFVAWEDDDIYLSWHIEAHAATYATNSAGWSKPSAVFALTTGELVREPAAGRLHASLAFSRAAYCQSGGWPLTRRADFDLQFIARLTRTVGPPAETIVAADRSDSSPLHIPSYVFRWGSTGHPHGQNFMHDGAGDEQWYDRAAAAIPPQPTGRQLEPRLDDETERIYAALGHGRA